MHRFLTILLLLGLISITQAQEPRLVPVEPGEATLNLTIEGDTTATGERIDPENTWYVLQNGGWYVMVGTVQVVAPLRIVTEDYAPGGAKDMDPTQFYNPAAPGNRAHLVPGLDAAGNSSTIFQYQGDLTLKGIHLWGRRALGFDQETSLQKNIVRAGAPDLNMTLIDCFCERDAQSIFRLDKENIVSTFRNTTFRNAGQIADPNNSRFIDTRGSDGQTMIFENCTFLNGSKHILLSGFGSGGVAEKYDFNHCSFVNNGHTLHLGRSKHSEIKNSLFINNGWLGEAVGAQNEDPNDRYPAIDALIDIDSLVIENVLQNQLIDIHHNNIWCDKETLNGILNGIYADSIGTGTERLVLRDFNALAETGAHDNLSESISFTKGPALPTDYCQNWNMAEWCRLTGGESCDSYFNALNGEFVVDTTGQNSYNLAYAASLPSYSASTHSLPLGDLRWFPEKFTEFVTAVETLSDEIPAFHTLVRNYPNPFNPTTTIEYSLEKNAQLTLTIYNVIGQAVHVLVDNKWTQAGRYEMQWDGRDQVGQLVPSGVYLCKIKAGDAVAINRMILLK